MVFTVSVGPDITVQSETSDLTEGAVDSESGTVSVTYRPEVTLWRYHNRQKAVCKVVWTVDTTVRSVTSEERSANVQCEYCT